MVVPMEAPSFSDLFELHLLPLLKGKTVLMQFSGKAGKSEITHTITVTPGSAMDAPPYAFLISNIGFGSCVVDARKVVNLSALILARVPSDLALALMKQLNSLYLRQQERQSHGNSTPSSRASSSTGSSSTDALRPTSAHPRPRRRSRSTPVPAIRVHRRSRSSQGAARG